MQLGKLKNKRFFLDFLVVASVVAGFFVANAYAATTYTRASMAGTYTCWSFNANGRGGKCTSPPLVLNKNGSYAMSSERGKYTIKGDTVVLSKSKFRGAGKILEKGMQIQFAYKYKGSKQTMTFLRKTPAAKSIVLELTIKYPSEDAMGWVNTVQLIPHGKESPTYDALAYNDTKDKTIVKAYWKKGVPGGKVYDVYTGTGFSGELIGTVDLTKEKKKTAKKKIIVSPKPAPSQDSPFEKIEEQIQPLIPSFLTPSAPAVDLNLPKCNPSIPKYSQPTCRD